MAVRELAMNGVEVKVHSQRGGIRRATGGLIFYVVAQTINAVISIAL